MIQVLGNGTLMGKLDLRLKSAYHLVPVHPDDRTLLGTRWADTVYVDTTLPFGLSSTPKIFLAVVDALLWIMLLQYLDDFILFSHPLLQEYSALNSTPQTCSELGYEAHKIDGPATRLVFLSIEIVLSSASRQTSCDL